MELSIRRSAGPSRASGTTATSRRFPRTAPSPPPPSPHPAGGASAGTLNAVRCSCRGVTLDPGAGGAAAASSSGAGGACAHDELRDSRLADVGVGTGERLAGDVVDDVNGV